MAPIQRRFVSTVLCAGMLALAASYGRSVAALKGPVIAGNPLPINIAAYTGPSIPVFALQAASVLGAYQKAGLAPNITETVSANLTPLIVSGRADVACGNGAFYGGLLAGQQYVSVVGEGGAQPYVLDVRPSIRSVADLRGKNVGVSDTAVQSTYLITEKLLTENKIKPNEVNYVVIATQPDKAAALVSGRIDATILDEDSSLSITGKSGIKVLLDNPAGPNFILPYQVCFATKAYAGTHQEELRRFALALVMTQRALNDKDTFAEAVGKVMPAYTPDVIAKAYKHYLDTGFWCVNGCVNPGWYEDTLGTQLKASPNRTATPKMSDFFSTAYVRWSLDQLGGVAKARTDTAAWYKTGQ